MSASQDECVAQFPRQQVCNDRVYSRLLSWAAYITAQPLPPVDTPPDAAWVQQRVLAERVPVNATMYQAQVSPYLMEIPNITDRIRDHLNAWNNEATETTLASDIDTSLAVVMPKYAAATVTQQDVDNWLDRNGYPVPE
jgi:hypothetical protein